MTGWLLIFDGKSLDGWQKYGRTGADKGTWTVEAGELVGRGGYNKLCYMYQQCRDRRCRWMP